MPSELGLAASPALRHGYPRPLLRRAGAQSLNGPWEFALDPDARWTDPDQVTWTRTIVVPFAPETQASGIGDTSFYRACWYRRWFDVAPPVNERLLLHFGAVDYDAAVWVNGTLAGRHRGGYTPFQIDITNLLRRDGPQVVIVCAEDDPRDLAKPRGKQDWQREPHGIWYPRTTGIWQTVWLERVPRTWISELRWTPSLERWEIFAEAWLSGEKRDDLQLRITLKSGRELLADDLYSVVAGEVHRAIALSDPGIDDSRNELLWSPFSPNLIDATLELRTTAGECIDVARSYTALRTVSAQGDRFMLNGRPFHLRLVLDQGYWPDSGMTPPDDDAVRRDVELVREMGFNGVRKHQKIEDPRYLYWADRYGVVVWEEMPSAYRFTQRSIERVTTEWIAVMARDASHPCIVAWVPFNESWGVPNLPEAPAQRHYVRSLYHVTKTLDGTRPVIGNDGWESVSTDIIGIHDYDANPKRISRRYGANIELQRLFRRERPGGRALVLERRRRSEHPLVLSEFGGIALSSDVKHTWGYSRSENATVFSEQYTALLEVVRSLELFTGFCYTQFSDTYQEANGLLYANRTPKFPLEDIARATSGSRPRPRRPADQDDSW